MNSILLAILVYCTASVLAGLMLGRWLRTPDPMTTPAAP